jgi:hypothetical protein
MTNRINNTFCSTYYTFTHIFYFINHLQTESKLSKIISDRILLCPKKGVFL